MKTNHLLRIIVAVAIPFGANLYVLSEDAECSRLQAANAESLASYLSSIVPDKSETDCVIFAIRRLGNQRYEPAIPALTRFLDFKRPLTGAEKLGFYNRPLTVDEMYPAANALEQLGRECLPNLMQVMKAASTSAAARENAVAVWMYFYRDEAPKGIALLKREARDANDLAVRQRLLWSVDKALTWCQFPAGEAAKCKTAARTGYPN